ncbi:MAG: UbiA family prenyltransferase [Bacteroidetes bacterium]|nr:UbiA family prenyltransferase [Bacteroidota bacterium]
MPSIKNYFSLIKFSHTIFAMPFALIGFFLGVVHVLGYDRPWPLHIRPVHHFDAGMMFENFGVPFIFVILCMVFARSAAMAFNRYLDRNIDAQNPRTAVREIPSGIITAQHALLFTIANSILFVTCAYFINSICFYLSPVALFVILFYSYTKRFTALCHIVLGIGLSLAPIGAYLAVTGSFALLPLLFSIAVICWVSGFDIIYALQDEAFDKSHQLYSIPSVMGKSRALMLSVFLHVLSASAVIFAGYYGNFGGWYWAGIVLFAGMLIYQHSIVKPNDLSRVNIAFMTANGIASVVFSGFVLLDLFAR